MFGRRTGNTRTLKLPQNLRDYAVIVENILKEMSVDVERSRLTVENGYGWRFPRGSVQINLMLMQSEERRYFQIYVPIVYLPQTGILPMYRRMLEYNLKLTGAALGVHNDIVYVYSERILQSFDPEEAKALISTVGEYADELDNKLASEFGARMYLQA
jgi:hypothetical protein